MRSTNQQFDYFLHSICPTNGIIFSDCIGEKIMFRDEAGKHLGHWDRKIKRGTKCKAVKNVDAK